MEQLSQTLKLAGAVIEEISLQPTEKEPKAILVVSAPLTPAIAMALDCLEMFYDIHVTPRPFEGHVGLSHLLKETSLTIGAETFTPDLVHKFRVNHESDVALRVSCRIHLTGVMHLHMLLDGFIATNKGTFALEISPRQGQLFAEGESDPQQADHA
jgi:hypothetical protein